MAIVSETLSAIVSGQGTSRVRPALHLGLCADAPGTPPARLSLAAVDEVTIGRAPARTIRRRDDGGRTILEVGLPDARLSGRHARLIRKLGRWVAEDMGSKNGTRVDGQPVSGHVLDDGDVVEIGHSFVVFRTAGGEVGDHDGAPAALAPGLATMSPALAERFADLAKVARSTVPVAITGESGSGKELAARAVHELSGRGGRFVAVNCGGLAAHLVEGELFGHRRGAFTGADEERLGLIRSADRGTLFLDEIAELPAAAQASLLRVLQEREVLAVGADRPVPVDLRVICATHRDLAAAVTAGRFREDLSARLLGASLHLPPLRERPEDLSLLIAALLERSRAEVTFTVDAARALYAHAWPLNVRELEHALATASALASGGRIEDRHLPEAMRGVPAAPARDADEEIRAALVAALERHGGNLAAVARDLGKDRTQIRRWMKRFGLERPGGDAD